MRTPNSALAKRALLLGGGAVVVLALVLAGRSSDAPRSRVQSGPIPPGAVTVPAGIPADCSQNVEAQLNAFIARLPNGARLHVPPGACYAQGNRIEVFDKKDLTIDGNGATFRSSAENDGHRLANPNWLILRGRNVRIRNMKIVGNFHLSGERSLPRVNEASKGGDAGATPNAGIGIYGGDGVHVSDIDISDVFGDGVLTGVSDYVDPTMPSQTPRNVRVQRVDARKTARHCFSPNQVVGFWLEDSTGSDCWYGALDAELDDVRQKLQDVHVINNTFSDFNLFGIIVPVAGDGDSTRDIEVRGNRFLTAPDQPCNPLVEVGIYPTNPNRFKNVVVEGNSMKAHGAAIAFLHVDGGRIRGNEIEHSDKNCFAPLKTPIVRLRRSTGVTVEDNGG